MHYPADKCGNHVTQSDRLPACQIATRVAHHVLRPISYQLTFKELAWDLECAEFAGPRDRLPGFSLLTDNRAVLAHPAVAQIAARHRRGIAQIIFRFALDVGMIPLTGTSDPAHAGGLDLFDFGLASEEVARIETLVASRTH